MWRGKLAGALLKEIEHREAVLRLLGELNRTEEAQEEQERLTSAKNRLVGLPEKPQEGK